MIRPHIRWSMRRDLGEMLAIEAANSREPWGEADFRGLLKQRNIIGLVAEHDERIVGFTIYGLHRRHIDLLNFQVHPDWSRQGIGRALFAKMAGKVEPPARRDHLMFDVPDWAIGLHLFLKAMGCEAIDVCRGETHDTYRFLFTPETNHDDLEAVQGRRGEPGHPR